MPSHIRSRLYVIFNSNKGNVNLCGRVIGPELIPWFYKNVPKKRLKWRSYKKLRQSIALVLAKHERIVARIIRHVGSIELKCFSM